MTMTPVEFAHLYLFGHKDKFQDPKTWPLGPSYGHWDQCKRLVALVEARDQEQIEMLARLIQEKEALAAENLQLRAQLDPDGPARALTQVVGMQTFTTKPGEPARKFRICGLCKGDSGRAMFCSACMGSGVVPE